MKIDFKDKQDFAMYDLAKRCGYTKHNLDYIRENKQGRFHLKYEGKQIWDLHYDIYVEWRHFSMDLPLLCGKEKGRILGIANRMFEKQTYKIKKSKKEKTFFDELQSKQPVKKRKKNPSIINTNFHKKFKPELAKIEDVRAEFERIRNNKKSWWKKLLKL